MPSNPALLTRALFSLFLLALCQCTTAPQSAEVTPQLTVEISEDKEDTSADNSTALPLSGRGTSGIVGSTTFYVPSAVSLDLASKVRTHRKAEVQQSYDSEAFKLYAYESLAAGNPHGALVHLDLMGHGKADLDDEALVIRGIAELSLGHPETGLELLARASIMNQRNILSDLNTGIFQLSRGNARSAISAFNQVLAKDKRNGPAHLFLGSAYFYLKDYDRAEDHYREAARSRSENGVARYNLALVAQYGHHNYPEARKILRELTEENGIDAKLRDQAHGAIEQLDRERVSPVNLSIVTMK